MTIVISQDGKNAQVIEKSKIQTESFLQEYIHNNPGVIPIYEIEENKKLFIAKREFPTNSGPIDALAIDDSGNIYIVETKLYKNPDKRLVVAQALDYGASLWRYYVDVTTFIEILNQETQRTFNLSFEDKVRDFFNLDDNKMQFLFDSLQLNLREGNIKFVVLMDKIDERMKDLILYVNQNSEFDIYAVQLDYYKLEKYEIMIPKIFGVEIKKNIKRWTSGSRIYWKEEGFKEEIDKLQNETKNKVMTLLEFAKQEDCLEGWGTGHIPMFTFKISSPFDTTKTATIFTIWSDGYIKIHFRYEGMYEKDIFDEEKEFYKMINAIGEVSVDRNQKRTDKIPIDRLSNQGIEEIKKAVSWLKKQFSK